MQCPVDGTDLKISERQGVEIDYCPKCRGVWLDRGELDKIIDRSTPAVPLQDPGTAGLGRDLRGMRARRDAPQSRDERDVTDERDVRDDDHGSSRSGRRRKSFLSDIFDFD